MAETNPEHAFPAIAVSPDGDVIQQEGMSLRDYFAAQALTGLLAAGPNALPLGGATEVKYARMAHDIADAMLAERSK